MRSDALLAVAGLFERALFVGDPGQLDPFSDRGRRAVGGAVLRPVGERGLHAARAQPGAAAAPAAGLLAAAGVGGAAGLGRVLSVHPVPQRHGPRRPAARLRRRRPTARRRTGCSTRRPSRAGACWSCPPGTPRAPTRRRYGRSPLVVRRLLDRGGAATSERSPEPGAAHRRPDRGRHRPPRPGGGGPRGARGAGRERGRRRHREPAPGPGVRRDGGPAPALRPPRRDGLPPGDGPPVRPGLPPPARLRRGVPRGRDGPAGRPPVDGAGPAGRDGEVPGRLGGEHAVLAHLAEHRVSWRP